MQLISLRLVNYKPFVDEQIDLENINLASIVGEFQGNRSRSNGSGKSSFVEAIPYALFGYSRTGSETDLIRADSDEAMFVELTARINGKQVFIRRGRKQSGTPIIEIDIDGVQVSSVRSADENIINELGADLDLFRATCFFEQDNADTFTNATPAKRKEYLINILRLSTYETLCCVARTLLSKAEVGITIQQTLVTELQSDTTDVEALQVRIQEIENKCAGLDSVISTVEATIEELAKGLNKRRVKAQQLETEQAEIHILETQLVKLKKDKSALEKAMDDKSNLINEEIGKINAAKTALGLSEKEEIEINAKLTSMPANDVDVVELSGNYSKLIEDLGKTKGQAENVNNRITEIEELGPVCPTCEKPMVESEKEGLVASYNEKLNGYTAKNNKLSKQISQLSFAINEANEQSKTRSSLVYKLEVCKNKIASATDKISSIQESVYRTKEYIAEQNIQLESLIKESKAVEEKIAKNRVEDVDAILKEISGMEIEVSKYKVSIKGHETEKSRLNIEKGSIQRQIQEAESKGKKIEECETKIKELEIEVYIQKTLIDAFGKNGIPAVIIANATREIEKEANAILQELETSFSISVQCKRKKKTGELADTLDIMVKDRTTIRDYKSYSGGERTLINFALRMALSTFLSRRSGTKLQSIFLDEIISSLDETNRQNVSKAIKMLAGRFKQVFLISHVDDIRDYLPTTIVVQKQEDGTSRIVRE